MDIIYIILLVFLAFRNSAIAKIKGKSPLLWGMATIVASIFAFMVGSMVVIFAFCKDAINFALLSATDAASRALVNQQLMDAINSNPLRLFTIELFGFGGYLAVRYIIDSKPDKKKPVVHWMDKMEEQKSEN